MKHAKKLSALLLALVMVLALSTTAFAVSGENSNDGKITIGNAVVGQVYTIYQILTLESYSTDGAAYSYKAADAWSGFINGEDIKGVYVDVDAQGYVTWKGDTTDARAAAFAKLAQAYAKANGTITGTAKTADSETVVFENLNLGYYLLDSTLGTLCSLNTTAKEVTIREKNAVPENLKKVQEDSNDSWGSVNDADIGQTVNFKSTVTLPKGSENVSFHDTMSAGLTLTAGSIKVYTDAGLTTELASENYTVTAAGLTDGCTFEISFAPTYLDSLTGTAVVYVGYAAVVNADAVVGGEGNPNESHLEYGDETNRKETPKDTTKTYTWRFDVLKYGNGDESNPLAGAQFVLLNSDKTTVAVIANGKLTGWADVPAETNGAAAWPEGAVLTTDAGGKIDIAGLDADTYYLRETKAPAGYNILSEDQQVDIVAAASNDGKTMTQTPVTVKINNQSGTELPSTGGIGTTVFYALGGVLMIGALVFFVARKRMDAEN